MGLLVHELRLALVALQFLTRVPVPRAIGFHPAWLQSSARHFPLVGAGVGAAGAAVLALATQVWPAPVAVLLSMVATVWLTGGFHEDGLADTCDGLGGSVSRERALQIMKDSRVGSYGVLGLVGVLALKAAALHALVSHGLAHTALPALLFAHVASRSAAVLLLRALPYAGDPEHAKAKPLAQRASAATAAVALAWTLASAAGLWAGLGRAAALPLTAALAACTLSTLVCARWFQRRLGGTTGDTLGAAQQLGELAALLGWLAALR
ncbi:adenosylcobinamide-GDP ribazoletransferase [Ideonella sp. BN130291]|uniref:adenosylcobinamide-GDP ribazoletransferase n=1 Tax=Ideonella sp. BN130291 TaxID=3112940 RepID=UPI002E26A097|nr:adenosylcobinamide-GDP ribazoletransferase [Ideonella sp. BN130291]